MNEDQNNNFLESSVDKVLSQISSDSTSSFQDKKLNSDKKVSHNNFSNNNDDKGKFFLLIFLNIILVFVALFLGIKIYEKVIKNYSSNSQIRRNSEIIKNSDFNETVIFSTPSTSPNSVTISPSPEVSPRSFNSNQAIENVEKELEQLNFQELDQPSSEIEQDLQQL